MMTIKMLRERIEGLPDNCSVQILFECTEAQPKGFQYQVAALDAFAKNDRKTFLICHEADYPGHYSKEKPASQGPQGEEITLPQI